MIAIAGCEEDVPPPSVQDYLDNPNILEAAMVRCAQNRSETRYEAECVNARQAVSIIEAKEDRARRDAFEAESERKRQALRRTQQAAAEARRMAGEAERLRREAEYLAQFGELPPAEDDSPEEVGAANSPRAVIPEPERAGVGMVIDPMPAQDGGNAPVAEPQPEQAPANDLEAVREELRRRNEETGN